MATQRADRIGEHNTAYLKNRKRVLMAQSVCGICGKPVDKTIKYPDPLSATIDHIIPISKGGHPSDISNLQLAHRWCNRQKSNKLFDIKERFHNNEGTFEGNGIFLHADWANYKAN